MEKKSVYDNDPLCKEMRRICGEYWDYRKLVDGKKSLRLNELKENCNEYSKSCGKSMEKVGNYDK
jgi:hypothetical protein